MWVNYNIHWKKNTSLVGMLYARNKCHLLFHAVNLVCSYLLFVANITNESCGEKFVMWRNFRILCVINVEKSKISPHVE